MTHSIPIRRDRAVVHVGTSELEPHRVVVDVEDFGIVARAVNASPFEAMSLAKALMAAAREAERGRKR